MIPHNQIRAVSVIKELSTDGHRPLQIIGDDYNTYIIKNSRGRVPDFCLLNEILCHHFLKEWNINTPDIALISVDKKILPENLSNHNRNHYFENLCFGSKYISNSIETTDFNVIAGQVEYRKIHRPDDIFLLSLFDIWIENDDRKPTNNNLILAPYPNGKMILTAFDHAFVFSTLKYTELDINHVNSSYNESILLSALGQSIREKTKLNDQWLKRIEQIYYLCIERCCKVYEQVSNSIPEEMGFTIDLRLAVYNFLSNKDRNKRVFQEFLSRLK